MIYSYTDLPSLIETIRELSGNHNLYLYGCGMYGDRYGKILNKLGIPWQSYIDGNPDKQGKYLNDKKICSIDSVEPSENNLAFLSLDPVYYQDVIANLDKHRLDYFAVDTSLAVRDVDLYLKSPSDKDIYKLASIKDKYKGKRCFIIGNGPSLTVEDLEKIKNEYSFSTNFSINLFDKTSWRPNFYVIMDCLMAQIIKEQDLFDRIYAETEMVFIDFFKDYYPNHEYIRDNIYYFKCIIDERDTVTKFAEDITLGMYPSKTTVYYMYQLAAYMGFSEIYLLGMDFSFQVEIHDDGSRTTNNVSDHPELYKINIPSGYYVDEILRGHMMAKEYGDAHGIKIYNATRGGKLEVFPRVDLNSLLN